MSDHLSRRPLAALNLVECSHHDLGWHKCAYAAEAAFTFDEINNALDRMETDPSFTWSHECCSFLYYYLQKYPERRQQLQKRIAEGRFDIGAGYAMPYSSFVTSEMLARLFIYGKKWVEDAFPGFTATVYYNTDVPALGLQMPQLMEKAGVPYLYASRSWNFDGFKSNEFRAMESPDGSRVRVFFMNHYTNMYFGDPEHNKPYENHDLMLGKIRDYQQTMDCKQVGPALPLLLEMDCMMPSDQSASISAWNAYAAEQGLPPLRYATMRQALDQVFTEEADLEQDVLRGEWPNKWFYENAASDDRTFRMQRDAARYLRTAEALAVIRSIHTGSFTHYPSGRLERGWRTCDHTCHGYAPEQCIVDFKAVYREALETARDVYQENLTWLAGAVCTDPSKGLPVVIFNENAWDRTDLVRMDLPEALEESFRLVNSDGGEIPFQRSADGKLLFLAEDVPSLGIKTYYLRSGETPASGEAAFEVGTPWTEAFTAGCYRITPVPGGGALESVVDLENGSKSLFSTEKFKIGELYDFQYDGMGAGEQLNMWQPHNGVSQLGYFGRWTCVESGPLYTAFETSAPAAARGPATLRLTVFASIKRIDFDMKLDLDSEGARQLRLMFPVHAGPLFGSNDLIDHSRTKVTYEVPFGAVTLGDEMLPKFSRFNDNTGDPNNVGGGQSDPADFSYNNAVRPREVQNWIEVSDHDNDFSLCLSSYNLGWDYQDATADPCRTPVLQPVLVSTSQACHWEYGKWLQPGAHCFHFSLTSGAQSNPAGRRMMADVNAPLAACIPAASGTLLPETWSGLRFDRENICLSALKKAEDRDEIVLRWYETEGSHDAGQVCVTMEGAAVTQARSVSLIERESPVNTARAENGALIAPVSPWSIETVMIHAEKR